MIWFLQMVLLFSNGESLSMDLHEEFTSRVECTSAKERLERTLENVSASPPGLRTVTITCQTWMKEGT